MAYDTEDPSFQAGREMRRELFGEGGVARMDAADDFNQPFEEYVTKAVFGDTWTRPGLTIRERCFITMAIAAALNRKTPLARLIRLAVQQGATKDDIKEVLLHTTMYIGVAGAVETWQVAEDTLKEMGAY